MRTTYLVRYNAAGEPVAASMEHEPETIKGYKAQGYVRVTKAKFDAAYDCMIAPFLKAMKRA